MILLNFRPLGLFCFVEDNTPIHLSNGVVDVPRSEPQTRHTMAKWNSTACALRGTQENVSDYAGSRIHPEC